MPNSFLPIIYSLAYPPLSEFVDTLFGRGAASLDHVKDSLLVRHEASYLSYHLPHELHAHTEALERQQHNRSKQGRGMRVCTTH